MSFLGDFIDDEVLETVEAPNYGDLADDTYKATVTDLYVREGTDSKPDDKWTILEYTTDDGPMKSEWFSLPVDPHNPTDAERQKIGYFVGRMADLGVPRAEVARMQPDDVIGKRVAITLRTKPGKGARRNEKFQNVTKVVVLPPEGGSTGTTRAHEPVGNTPAPKAAAGGTRRANPYSRG